MPSVRDSLAAIAQRHRLSAGAVGALAEALERSRGGGVQWNHPDLGGMGQWLRGGMLQIGAMFDADLKARVAAVLSDLEPLVGREPPESVGKGSRDWWPEGLGAPSATGAQNGMRYACFPAERRLVVDDNGRLTVFDTGRFRLTGFAQAEGSSMQDLAFSGPDGAVRLGDLVPVG